MISSAHAVDVLIMWPKLFGVLLFVTMCHSQGDRTSQNDHKVLNDVPDENGACPAGDACREGATTPRFASRVRTVADSRRFLDFVFIVECPCGGNGSQLNRITDSLATWLHLSLTYLRPHSRLAIVQFSSHLDTTDVKEFTPLHSNLTTSIPALCEDTCTSFDTASQDTSINYGGYSSMGHTLQLILDVLAEREIPTSLGSTKRLYLRPHADTHLISITGLLDTSQSGSGSRKKTSKYKCDVEDLVSSLIESTHLSHTALHFFVSTTSKAASLIGSAKHAVRYRDCTHFNKAQTLSELIRAGEGPANSLQAHLLAKGVRVEVSDVHDLLNRDCLRNLNPSLWSQFDLHTLFEDKCVRGLSCPSGMVCHPLHGCVMENMVESSFAIGEDKAPLPTDLSTSHADIASSTSPHSGPLLTESLSIVEDSSNHSPFSLADVIAGSPEVLLWSPEKPFVEEMIKKGVPVVIRNSVVSSWPASRKWSLSYVAENIGMDMLPHVKCTNTSLTFDPDRRVPLKLNLSLPYTVSNMSKEAFFACVQEEGSCSRDGYSGHYYFGAVPETLRADLQPDVLLYNTDKDHAANKQFMWISSSGMITHGHFDQDFNFFVQLVGEKRFTLWSPSQHEMMYVFPRTHPLWHKSRVNFKAPDLSRFPQFALTRALQVTVGPGDVLFIPPYTWHYVETLSSSISLSTWSHDYQLYDHMSAIYRHDHKFDLIADTRGKLV